MKKDISKSLQLSILCLVALADYMGLSIVLTTFAPLLLSSQASAFYSPFQGFGTITTVADQLTILGLLLATFPFGAFLFAPFWGALSDKYGRKPILQLTLFKAFLSYAIVCLGLFYHSLWLLFFGRFLGGIMAGNVTVAQSAVVDMSCKQNKATNLSRMTMSIGFGFLFGPVIGGALSHPNSTHFMALSAPYLVIAFLFLLLWITLSLFIKKDQATNKDVHISLSKNITAMFSCFRINKLRLLMTTWLGFSFGINLIQFCLSAYLVHTFAFSVSQISVQITLFSTAFVLTNAFIIPKLLHTIKAPAFVLPGLFSLSIATLTLTFISNQIWLYPAMIIWGIANGCIYGGFFPTISNVIDKKTQGQVLGALWSLNALAQVIEPSISGWLFMQNYRLPFILGFIFCLIAIIAFSCWYNSKKREAHAL